jgi:hypothetical protein
LVQEEKGEVVAEEVEAGANLSDLLFVTWALNMGLWWGLGAVA